MTYWPVAEIRLTAGEVVLAPTVDADLAPLADLLPADVELDPRLPDHGLTGRAARGVALHQGHWRHLGSWSAADWCLDFTVRVGGELAGMQSLEGTDFARLRTVESASWLGTEFRGRGIGKLMRLAVLALAFEGLGALVAETEAWHDNAASLGVSRSLGYLDNGTARHARGDGADDMPRLRMPLSVWRDRHAGTVDVSVPAAALPFFGV